MNQPLTYYGYCLRRLKIILKNEVHVFINPVIREGIKYLQVQVVNDQVFVFDGTKWTETKEEGVLFECIKQLVKKSVQKDLEFREAV